MQDIEAIVETSVFRRDADRYLSAVELQALRLLLTNDPLIGIPAEQDEAIRIIDWRIDGTLRIEYLVAPGKVFLLALQVPNAADGDRDPASSNRIKVLLDAIRNSGIGWGVKEILDALKQLLGL